MKIAVLGACVQSAFLASCVWFVSVPATLNEVPSCDKASLSLFFSLVQEGGLRTRLGLDWALNFTLKV